MLSKWTFAYWIGIRASSLFDGKDFFNVARTAALKELQASGFIWFEDDPKDASEVIVHLTKQGRDEMASLFYSKKSQKELKRLFKRADSIKPPPKMTTDLGSLRTPPQHTNSPFI